MIEASKTKKIMILGDYDVDGTTSTAMLFKYFDN
jgi:single-stranded DNA-specific DHH superfamily exonuclease